MRRRIQFQVAFVCLFCVMHLGVLTHSYLAKTVTCPCPLSIFACLFSIILLVRNRLNAFLPVCFFEFGCEFVVLIYGVCYRI